MNKNYSMADQYFHPILNTIGNRIVSKGQVAKILLDKNEQPEDIDNVVKRKVLDDLYLADWNRYPEGYTDIEKGIAAYCGLPQNFIAIAPGSAYLITVLLNYFAINRKHLVIGQPSYTLFNYHCQTYNIEFEPWYLSSDLEFDINTIPELTQNSVVILASPNNPVGNIIETADLEHLLNHPAKPLVVVDAVYFEYSNFDINDLILRYDNLIVLRSFSKAFPAAGIRLGYICAQERVLSSVKKLILLFSINHFTLAYAKEVINNPTLLLGMKNKISKTINERDNLYRNLSKFAETGLAYSRKSEGNFLLIKIPNASKFDLVMNELSTHGIKVCDTSCIKMLENTFRVSIGTADENEAFLKCMDVLY